MIQDYNTPTSTGQTNFFDITWAMQTFTPYVDYTISSVSFKMARNNFPGTITVSIRAVDGVHKPTGPDLAVGTTDGDTLPDGIGNGEWRNISFNTPLALSANVEYSFVLSAVDAGSATVYPNTNDVSSYARGKYTTGSNGTSWNTPSDSIDILFQTFDDEVFVGQSIIVAGEEDGGNHLWKLEDDGTNLSVASSHTMPGNVNYLAYSPVSKRLYAAIGNLIYCYDPSDMSLITSWGSSGSVDLGVSVNGLAVDSSDNLAVAHEVHSALYRMSLYDEDGILLWRSSVFGINTRGRRVDFDLNGDVNGCTLSGQTDTWLSAAMNFVDGTLHDGYRTRTSGWNSQDIVSSRSIAGYVYYLWSSSLTFLTLDRGDDTFVDVSISGTAPSSIRHWDDFGILIVSDGGELRVHDDSDVSFISEALSDLNQITDMVINYGVDDLYAVTTQGDIGVANQNGSVRIGSILSVSSVDLTSVVTTGSTNILPVITDQSSDQTVEFNDVVDLYVTATGFPSPTYQWYLDDILIAGATSSTYQFTVSEVLVGGVYKCIATNIVGSDTSDNITISVVPTIQSQSSDTVVPEGQLAAMLVDACGFPDPTYQWYRNDVLLVGETATSISVYGNASTVGTYKCVVTNAVGSVTSANIELSTVTNANVYNLFDMPLDGDRVIT